MFTCHRRYLILAMSVSEPRTLLTYSRIPQTLDDTPGKKKFGRRTSDGIYQWRCLERPTTDETSSGMSIHVGQPGVRGERQRRTLYES